MHFDEVDKALDSEVREGHHAVFADAVDPYHTIITPSSISISLAIS